MGTRNFTVIIKDGKIKLSQYGQWDGYFSYTGKKFLEFVKEKLQGTENVEESHGNRMKIFAEKVDLLQPVSPDYLDKVEKAHESMHTEEFYIPYKVMFPQFHRDTGVKILNLINSIETIDMLNKENGEGKLKFPVEIDRDYMCAEFINVINMDTDMIYMLTTHEFEGGSQYTTKVINHIENAGFRCWYKSKIVDLPSIEVIQKYKDSIKLDYYTKDNGETVSY